MHASIAGSSSSSASQAPLLTSTAPYTFSPAELQLISNLSAIRQPAGSVQDVSISIDGNVVSLAPADITRPSEISVVYPQQLAADTAYSVTLAITLAGIGTYAPLLAESACLHTMPAKQ